MYRIEIPDIMPVLSHGNHDDPSEGACFMEYTALLAGEPFSDHPNCVDPTITSYMMWVNDSLLDADRHLLVPFLGRGIGLVPPRFPRWISYAEERRMTDWQQAEAAAKYTARIDKWRGKAAEFRRDELMPRLIEAIPGLAETRVYNHPDISARLIEYFGKWGRETRNYPLGVDHGYHEGCPDTTPCPHLTDKGHRAAVDKMLEIADILHTCYEQAMEAKGWTVKRELACELPAVMEKVGK